VEAVPKKEFTSFDAAAVVRELRDTILDSHVNNVYQLDSKTLLLKLHKTDKPPLNLVLDAGRRLHLTSYAQEKPETPPAFCMALRKHLRNGWLTNVEQYEFERVVVFSFKTITGNLRLVLELFGDGNVILVDENDKIVQALVYKRMRDRNILRDEAFVFAPSSGKNPLKVSKEEVFNSLRGFGEVEVVRAVARLLSVGGVYSEESLLRAEIDKTKPCNALTEGESNAILDALQELLSRVLNGVLEPCVVLDENGDFVDVVPFKLKRYEDSGFKIQTYSSFDEALDEFYVRIIATEKAAVDVEVEALKREAERLKRIIADQEKVLAETEGKTELDKQLGDLIYTHSSELLVLLDKFTTGKQSGKEWKTIASEVLTEKKAGLKPGAFFESFDPKRLIVNISVDGVTFGLDLRKTVFENAAGFYERNKQVKQKLTGVKTALKDSRRKLAEVEKKIGEAEALQHVKSIEAAAELTKLKVKHREWFEKFRWFISSDGFLVVAGKDAVSNEVLIKKYTEDTDVVFHADIVGAPFVIVKTEKKKPNEQCLREAAQFAAAFSKGWREGFGSVDVYWVKPQQLSKGGPSGESVAHGAFVVRGERNWLRDSALKLAIGVILNRDGEPTFIGGPISAVEAKTDAYVVVVPGDLSGKDLFKRIIGALAMKASREMREKVLKASVEEIREFVPYSIGRVLEE
jgi:predicted ribosome quality control (RQC) complex YloA/Tae2 family protein